MGTTFCTGHQQAILVQHTLTPLLCLSGIVVHVRRLCVVWLLCSGYICGRLRLVLWPIQRMAVVVVFHIFRTFVPIVVWRRKQHTHTQANSWRIAHVVRIVAVWCAFCAFRCWPAFSHGPALELGIKCVNYYCGVDSINILARGKHVDKVPKVNSIAGFFSISTFREDARCAHLFTT